MDSKNGKIEVTDALGIRKIGYRSALSAFCSGITEAVKES